MSKRTVLTFNMMDNDFSSANRFAMDSMNTLFRDDLETAPLEQVKEMYVALMIGYQLAWLRTWRTPPEQTIAEAASHYHHYFMGGKLEETKEASEWDANSAAISIDFHRNYIWIH